MTGTACIVESVQAVTSSVRETQGRGKEWESGAHIQCLALGISKNSHVDQRREVMSIRKSVWVVYFHCHQSGWGPGRPMGVVAGRTKCQTAGRNCAIGESSGAGRSPGDTGDWKGYGLHWEKGLWENSVSESSLTVGHNIPYISW